MVPAHLLVVAPNSDLRQSLAFALEAEGFYVTTADNPPLSATREGQRFDCTIIDQKALTGQAFESIAFCIKAHPVILLSATPLPWLIEWVSQVVEMPDKGGALTAAILNVLMMTRGSDVPFN